MFIRILFGVLFIAGVSGCATTQNKAAQQDQMQARVTELEKKLEEKDAEIVDLQYEVKDLSSKVGSPKTSAAAEPSVPAEPPAAPAAAAKGGNDIIRVAAAPEQVQAALKAAGVYSGKVDGKIGAGTKAAIVAFQRSQGLTADGVVGRKTWDALKTYLK